MIVVHFDGAAIQNQKAGYGFTIYDTTKRKRLAVGSGRVPDERPTNNVAEHYAVIRGLDWLIENGLLEEQVLLKGDSRMVIFQLFRGWKGKLDLPYYPYMAEARRLLKRFTVVDGEW